MEEPLPLSCRVVHYFGRGNLVAYVNIRIQVIVCDNNLRLNDVSSVGENG